MNIVTENSSVKTGIPDQNEKPGQAGTPLLFVSIPAGAILLYLVFLVFSSGLSGSCLYHTPDFGT
jgi:hypothetical protein